MPKYLAAVTYKDEGVSAVIADGGTKRSQIVHKLVESVGGSVESLYFAFGPTDLYVIVDVPDNAAAAAVSLAANSTGLVAARFTPLMTAGELDDAVTKIPSYRPPGA